MRMRHEAENEKRKLSEEAKLRAFLYYTYKRTDRWATIQVYAFISGRLRHVGKGRFQPGASAGIRYEVKRVANDSPNVSQETIDNAECLEIEPGL